MSENFRVLAGIVFAMIVAVGISYLTTEHPFSLSLVDRECENAQQQYYAARNGLGVNNDKYPSQQEESRRDANEHADVCAQKLMASAAERGLWALGFTLAFTACAAVFAGLTWRTMDKTSRRQLRAYVGVESHVIDKLAIGTKTRVRITIQNFGQTPAYGLQNSADLLVAAIEESTFVAEQPTGARVLNPGDKFIMSSEADNALTAADTVNFGANTHRMFSFGTVLYKDTFGQEHVYEYRFEYGNDHSVAIRAFAISANGNTST